jgi:hypothetical protein
LYILIFLSSQYVHLFIPNLGDVDDRTRFTMDPPLHTRTSSNCAAFATERVQVVDAGVGLRFHFDVGVGVSTHVQAGKD